MSPYTFKILAAASDEVLMYGLAPRGERITTVLTAGDPNHPGMTMALDRLGRTYWYPP